MRPAHTRFSFPSIVLLLWLLAACSSAEAPPGDDDDSADEEHHGDHGDHLAKGEGRVQFGDNPSMLDALNAVFTATAMDAEVSQAAYRIEAGVGLSCELLRQHHTMTQAAQTRFDQNGDVLERVETILQSRLQTWDLPNWLVRIDFGEHDPRESPLPPQVVGSWYGYHEDAPTFEEGLFVLDNFSTEGTTVNYELDWQSKEGWVIGWVESTAVWRDRPEDFVLEETFTLRAEFEAPICDLDQQSR